MWKPSEQCTYPSHEPAKRGQKSKKKAYKTIPVETIMKSNTMDPYSYKIGAKVCKEHYTLINEELKNFVLPKDDTPLLQIESDLDSTMDDVVGEDDPYVPPVYIVSEDSINENTALSETLQLSPLKWRAGKPVEHLSRSSINYYRKKKGEWMNASEHYFDEMFAPGQSEKLRKTMEINETSVPSDLIPLVQNYTDSDSYGKLIILSLVNHEEHSKAEIMTIFGCSKRSVDQARALRAKQTGVFREEKKVFRRNKLNITKCEHFIQFWYHWSDARCGVRRYKHKIR